MILRRRQLVAAVFLVVVATSAFRSLRTRPVYMATVQLLIDRQAPAVLAFKEVAALDAGGLGADYYETQYKLLLSRSLGRRVVDELDLLNDPEFGGPRSPQAIEAIRAAAPGASPEMEGAISAVLGRLNVQPVKNSRLVNVSFEAFRPELTAKVVNKHAEIYIRESLARRTQTSADAARWLSGQIEEQRKKVETAEVALQKLKERDGIVNIEERRGLLEQKLKELGSSLNALTTQRLEKEALYRQMRDARSPEELPEVMRSPLIQSLRIDLAVLERQQAQLLGKYLDQHPEVEKVRNQIRETRQKIAAEAQRVVRVAENDYQTTLAQQASLSSALESAKAEALELSRRGLQYDVLNRELVAAKEVADSLVSRLKQTDVAQELKSTNMSVVDWATLPRYPVRPRPFRDIQVGILFGLVLGVGLAFFLDYLDNTLKTPEDVLTRLKTPILCVIPETRSSNGDRGGLMLLNAPHQEPFAEGYQLLRTALNYSWSEQKPRIVAITSTAPAEGKTLTSVNLALTLSSGEGRVLLIDGDLRRPGTHSLLRAKRSPGLSDILVGQSKPSDAIQRVSATSLSLLASGSTAPSPADLLTADALHVLLESLRGLFKWVIIDTPPVAAVADALIISQIIDGAVVVAGAEMVAYRAVRRTLERVAETGTRVLGVVLNRAQVERHSYYYASYYGHYYSPTYRPEGAARDGTTLGRRAAR